MLNIRDLELVEAIVTNDNFTRAARVLGIGQSVLTRRVADLEHRLGTALFRRAHSGAEPTNICRALGAGTAEVLERMRALEQRLVGVRGGQEAELRIGAGGIAADTGVLSAAAATIGARPGVRVQVATMNWMNVACCRGMSPGWRRISESRLCVAAVCTPPRNSSWRCCARRIARPSRWGGKRWRASDRRGRLVHPGDR